MRSPLLRVGMVLLGFGSVSWGVLMLSRVAEARSIFATVSMSAGAIGGGLVLVVYALRRVRAA